MTGFHWDKAAVDTALKHLNSALTTLRNADSYSQSLQNVQRPGDSPSTDQFHQSLVQRCTALQTAHDKRKQEITETIKGLKAVQAQYAAGEEVTWQGFKNKEA